jgi:hypothetical protein
MEEITQLEVDVDRDYTEFLVLPRTALKQPYDIHQTLHRESVLNAFVNRKSYENEIRETLAAELSEIISFSSFHLLKYLK